MATLSDDEGFSAQEEPLRVVSSGPLKRPTRLDWSVTFAHGAKLAHPGFTADENAPEEESAQARRRAGAHDCTCSTCWTVVARIDFACDAEGMAGSSQVVEGESRLVVGLVDGRLSGWSKFFQVPATAAGLLLRAISLAAQSIERQCLQHYRFV